MHSSRQTFSAFDIFEVVYVNVRFFVFVFALIYSHWLGRYSYWSRP